MTTTIDQLSDNAIAQTEDSFNEYSQQISKVEKLYLDGPFDVESIKRRLLQHKQAIGQHIYYMGRDLIALKEHCDHGQFLQSLDQVGIAERTARRYMAVAVKFNSPRLQQVIHNLNSDKGVFSKLLELAAEPDEDLEKLIDGGTVAGLELDDIDRMSAKELRDALKKARADHAADRAAHDQVIAQKNQHADGIARELAKLQGRTTAERWPEIVDAFKNDFTAFGSDAEKMVGMLFQALQGLPQLLTEDTPDSARKSASVTAVVVCNQLANVVGQLQHEVYAEFAEFVELPTFTLGDPMQPLDDDEAAL